ncbi:uncharacterized protein DUF4873 [Amycolatopsis sulphurea]|uniref:Uncharacterized protein DUF4873 n=1 Tax=Amycolatopsis sulphurea TaxID=76022 RepID=A0A2A9F8K3_9PSEU|nr:DUF4873 domain-containing protein [Amycolatopsis sulphurea]PFG47293.1 uncharacterized protein DUF4873 [Amycolatopsis sulphurea]
MPKPTQAEESEHDEDGYRGQASIVVGTAEPPVEVVLRGHFQPIDGYYHWYGRIAVNSALAEQVGGRRKRARSGSVNAPRPAKCPIRTPGRYRITGRSTPPFPIPTRMP